jgi:hypothetical protein
LPARPENANVSRKVNRFAGPSKTARQAFQPANSQKDIIMSKSTKISKRSANLDTVLNLATTTAQAELGTADNKSVTAAATLDVSSTEGDTTTANGHNASVTLGTTSSTSKKSS